MDIKLSPVTAPINAIGNGKERHAEHHPAQTTPVYRLGASSHKSAVTWRHNYLD